LLLFYWIGFNFWYILDWLGKKGQRNWIWTLKRSNKKESKIEESKFDNSVHLSLWPNVCLSECLYVQMSVCPNVSMSKCLYVQMSVWQNVCMAKCLSVQMSLCPNVCLSKCLYGRMSVYPNVCLSFSFPIVIFFYGKILSFKWWIFQCKFWLTNILRRARLLRLC